MHSICIYCKSFLLTTESVNSLFQDYFFDKDKLTLGGSPPNDRGCRVCLKIGHIAKECPVVLNRKERSAPILLWHDCEIKKKSSPP